MRFILSFLIFTVYALGVSLSDPTKAFSPSVKVKIEHTHEVVKGHVHHHDFENDGGHDVGYEHDHEHNGQADHKHSVPHSHEVSVSMVNGFVLNSGLQFSESIIVRPSNESPVVNNEHPPKDVAQNSIFRPPIA